MKTEDSFFVSNKNSNNCVQKDKVYILMKKKPLKSFKQNTYEQFDNVNINQSFEIENIFRYKNNTLKNHTLNDTNKRPVGGNQLFKKMSKLNYNPIEGSTCTLQKRGSKKQIKEIKDKTTGNTTRTHNLVNPTNIEQKQVVKFTEQIFKEEKNLIQKYNQINRSQNQKLSNRKYRPRTSFPNKKDSISPYSQTPPSGQNLKKSISNESYNSSQRLQTQVRTRSSQLKWIDDCTHNYLDKMAVLNQISYNRPLVQKLGGNYFASSLRNRYQTESDCQSKSSFIYQIKDKLVQSKFITYAQQIRPLMQRTKLFLKGRNKQFYQKHQKIIKDQFKTTKDQSKHIRWNKWDQDQQFQS